MRLRSLNHICNSNNFLFLLRQCSSIFGNALKIHIYSFKEKIKIMCIYISNMLHKFTISFFLNHMSCKSFHIFTWWSSVFLLIALLFYRNDLHFAIFPIGELDALRHNKSYEPWIFPFPLEKYVYKYTCKYLFIMFVFDFSLQFEGIFSVWCYSK